uniref:Transposase n=1 Tax=Steinernema glaseri TaxID=37863 RepID=A0A1I8AU16_9BILA
MVINTKSNDESNHRIRSIYRTAWNMFVQKGKCEFDTEELSVRKAKKQSGRHIDSDEGFIVRDEAASGDRNVIRDELNVYQQSLIDRRRSQSSHAALIKKMNSHAESRSAERENAK